MKRFFIIFVLATLINSANAYIDPGTGSIFIQLIIAGVLGGLFFIKKFFRNILIFLKITKVKK